jgi:hypothetical protein
MKVSALVSILVNPYEEPRDVAAARLLPLRIVRIRSWNPSRREQESLIMSTRGNPVRQLLPLIGVALAAAPAGAQLNFIDDFESYTLGENNLAAQSAWEIWGGTYSASMDASVVVDPIEGDQCVRLDSLNANNPSLDDLVHPFGAGITSGQEVLEVHVMVPSGQSAKAYVIAMNTYQPATFNMSWSLQVHLSSDTHLVSADFNAGTAPLILDAWGTLRVEIDLDIDRHNIYWTQGGNQYVLKSNAPWSSGVSGGGAVRLASFNLYQDFGTAYYDMGDPPTTNSPPVALCLAEEITVEAEGDYGALVTGLNGVASFDPDGDAISFHWDVSDASVVLDDPTSPTPTGFFPIGITMATLTVTDGNGGFDTCDVLVTVQDTTPPEVMCTTDLAALWPPSHEMRTVRLIVTGTDNVTNPEEITVASITVSSDEPDDSDGDGSTIGDVDGEDGHSAPVEFAPSMTFDPTVGDAGAWIVDVQLRAERDGEGDGRCYTIDVEAFDTSGNSATTSCCVVVPHNNGKK